MIQDERHWHEKALEILWWIENANRRYQGNEETIKSLKHLGLNRDKYYEYRWCNRAAVERLKMRYNAILKKINPLTTY